MLAFSTDRPLLVFGGPYSNLAATEAIVSEAQGLGVPASHVICTGDVVAYCAEPEETARLVRDWGCRVIQGNCEEQLAAGSPDCACNFEEGTACDLLAKGWYPYADARVSAAARAWMGALPKSLVFAYGGLTFRVVHGGVGQINRWVFASMRDVLAEEMASAGADVVIAGHAGVPFIARAGRGIWFNPGVIGMPANDGTPNAWYGLIRAERGRVSLATRRLGYDHHRSAAAMRRGGYANGYARALVTGIWPSFDVFPDAEKAQTGVRIKQKTVRVIRPALVHAQAAAWG